MEMTEKIRQQAKGYAFDNDGFGYDLNTCEDIFTDGAEWALSHPTSDYMWMIYNFINDWRNGEYGTIPLQDVADSYFADKFKSMEL